VLKSLAFGASLVGLGRPILYALAAGGENGINDLVGGITRELARLMCMVGVSKPVNVPKEILIAR
jgi:4-hydroxymandelate oxidase